MDRNLSTKLGKFSLKLKLKQEPAPRAHDTCGSDKGGSCSGTSHQSWRTPTLSEPPSASWWITWKRPTVAGSTTPPGLDSRDFLVWSVPGPGAGLGLRSHPKAREAAARSCRPPPCMHHMRWNTGRLNWKSRDMPWDQLKVVVVDCSARHWWKHARRLWAAGPLAGWGCWSV